MSTQLTEESPRQRARTLLLAWLERADGQVEQLIRWLQDNDLPTIRPNEEPYLTILQALPVGAEHSRAKKELAKRAASILNMRPDAQPVGEWPEQLLLNLLMLCAGLARFEELAEPLYEMFERRALRGAWKGIELCNCLRDALIENQIDDRLRPVWKDMLAERERDFLPGGFEDGFEGVRLIRVPDKPGEPVLDAIGFACKAVAERLQRESDYRSRFKVYLNSVIETYPGRPTWYIDLVHLADYYQWPDWAVECIPRLSMRPKGNSDQEEASYYLWWPVVDALHEGGFSSRVERTFCNGHISLAYLDNEAIRFVERIAPTLDETRLGVPYDTSNAVVEAISFKMRQLETELNKDDLRGANALHSLRIKILKREHHWVRLVREKAVGFSARAA